jgi:hypothetical protein
LELIHGQQLNYLDIFLIPAELLQEDYRDRLEGCKIERPRGGAARDGNLATDGIGLLCQEGLLSTAPAYCFSLRGGIWLVLYGSEHGIYAKRYNGMDYIAQLLAKINTSIPALEMRGSDPSVGHDAYSDQPIADEEALSKYYARLQELNEEIDEAKADNDQGKAERLEVEKEKLIACSTQPMRRPCAFQAGPSLVSSFRQPQASGFSKG